MTQLARYSIAFIVPPAYFVYIDFRGNGKAVNIRQHPQPRLLSIIEMIQLPTAPW